MSPLLLVHGAFRGGWAWSRVRPLLVAAGREVHAPSLLGCGERAPWAEHVTSLATWVDELVALVEYEDLHDLVAVGHSQGGVVVAALAARIPERLAHLVFLDAAVPAPGERAVDLTPTGAAPGDLPPRATIIPARPLDAQGDLDAATAAWINRRLTPTPFAPSLDPLPEGLTPVPTTYAFCAETPPGYPSHTTRHRLDIARTPYMVLEAGHDAPLTAPDAVAELLLAVSVGVAA